MIQRHLLVLSVLLPFTVLLGTSPAQAAPYKKVAEDKARGNFPAATAFSSIRQPKRFKAKVRGIGIDGVKLWITRTCYRDNRSRQVTDRYRFRGKIKRKFSPLLGRPEECDFDAIATPLPRGDDSGKITIRLYAKRHQ